MAKIIDILMDIHLNNGIYNKRIPYEFYDIYYSDIIDDEYWNYALIKDKNANLKKICEDIYEKMTKLDRKSVLYSPMILKQNYLKELYTDIWLMLDNIDNFPQYKSDLDIKIVKVNKEDVDDFVDAVINGFSTGDKDDPYAYLPDSYHVAMLNSFKSDYNFINNYCVKYNEEIIGTATIIYRNNYAIMYNVTTNKKYKKHGVFKELMSEMIKDLKKIGITIICCQTEKNCYPELIYKKIGFKEIMQATAYEIKEE